MIELYKFCPKKYNPKFGYKYLQLGTLTYYREMETEKNIADKNEGLGTTFLRKYDSKVDGLSFAKKFHLTGGNIDDNNIHVNLTNCSFIKKLLNCYLFCLSINSNNNIAGSCFCESYDSYYKVTDLDKFIRIIGNSLFQIINIQDFDDKEIKRIKDIKTFKNDLKLLVLHQPVKYDNSKSRYLENVKAQDENSIDKGREILFTKDEQFSKDEEYRIAFVFGYDGKDLPVKNRPIKIPCKGILGIIE